MKIDWINNLNENCKNFKYESIKLNELLSAAKPEFFERVPSFILKNLNNFSVWTIFFIEAPPSLPTKSALVKKSIGYSEASEKITEIFAFKCSNDEVLE